MHVSGDKASVTGYDITNTYKPNVIKLTKTINGDIKSDDVAANVTSMLQTMQATVRS